MTAADYTPALHAAATAPPAFSPRRRMTYLWQRIDHVNHLRRWAWWVPARVSVWICDQAGH